MEGLIKRTWILAGVMVACGAFTMYVPPARSKPINEGWMAAHAPAKVGDFTFEPDPATPDCSYKMGSTTYSTLQPSGILARLYKSGGKEYDVVLIASDNSVSFHDPRVCFTASGWNITHEKHVNIKTAQGEIPVTYVNMQGEGQTKSALYFYRSPSGFESVARKMRWDMLIGELLHGRNDQGVFYRFIPMSNDITDQDLMTFASQYLDEAHRVSGGFF
jgi:hypothetical protein